MAETETGRTAGEAGWHESRYNVSAPLPDSKNVAIVNLFKGTCAEYNRIELYLLSVLEELDEHHPIIERFAKRGVIARYDERAALETLGRGACARAAEVSLAICPTMGCNFDCPYCFENHFANRMSQEVQDDVVALAGRMLETSGIKKLHITWFGGEPLLEPKIIESLSERLMALAKEHGAEYDASIATNGYLLTQDVVDMLERCKVSLAQITIDGMGAHHDATRHLHGGGATFDRIVSNLRDNKFPFHVHIRHNVHVENRGDVDELSAFIEQLAEESGNDLTYYPSPVTGSEVADARGKQVGLLCASEASAIEAQREAGRFQSGHGHYCGAHIIWSVGIDEQGNLQKCWESVDKPSESFGTAHDWDPANPIGTASNPDNLTKFLNTALPLDDEECQNCVWLPMCVGGCPHSRLAGQRQCTSFKDDPTPYVLALYANLKAKRSE